MTKVGATSMLRGLFERLAHCSAMIEGDVGFEVTKSSSAEEVPVPDPGTYGSLFVQDNGTPGTGDFADESLGNPLVADCGLQDSFELEPVVSGNFTAHY
jgi:hypothetical protein